MIIDDEYTNACSGWGCVDGCGDCQPSYTLDSHIQPGVVMVVVDGHPSYTAENFSQAETFVHRLLSTTPLLLPAPSDVDALITRVLVRIANETRADRIVAETEFNVRLHTTRTALP